MSELQGIILLNYKPRLLRREQRNIPRIHSMFWRRNNILLINDWGITAKGNRLTEQSIQNNRILEIAQLRSTCKEINNFRSTSFIQHTLKIVHSPLKNSSYYILSNWELRFDIFPPTTTLLKARKHQKSRNWYTLLRNRHVDVCWLNRIIVRMWLKLR